MTATDRFPGNAGYFIAGPANDVLDGDTEKHNTNSLSKVGRAFYCVTAGNVKVVTAAGTTITFPIVADVIYPIRITQLFDTGTTAVGVWILSD